MALMRRLLRRVTLLALDGAAVVASILAAASLSGAEANAVTPALLAFSLVGLTIFGSYGAGPARRDSQRLVGGLAIALFLSVIPGTLPTAPGITGQFLAVFVLAGVVALILERQLVDSVVHQAYVRGFGLRKAVVVCRSSDAADMVSGLTSPRDSQKHRADDQLVVGYVTPDDAMDPGALGGLSRLGEILDAHDVSELVVASTVRQVTLSEVADECFERGVRLFVIPNANHQLNAWAELTNVGRWQAYHLHPNRLEMPALLMKRGFDLVFAGVGMLILAPLMATIAIAIGVETRGPVFFRQRRVGLGGREFMMWKFRSMLPEAEARQAEIAHLNPYSDGRLFKLPRDPRITRVGRFLRRFSLDELPQLFNVIVGDMSLVGPRPPLPSEVANYEDRHFVRLSVVPGLTGPWQVNGRNLITDFEEVVRLEQEYIEGWSLRSDLEIVLRTVSVVLSGKGAY